MVHPEGQAAPQQEVPVSGGNIKSEFLDKMSEIPTVNTAKEYGAAVYNQVKGYNRFTAAALTVAESTALYLAITAKPFLEKVQPQAKAIDHLAFESLSMIEQKVPFIMLPPEELIEEARKITSCAKESAAHYVDDAKNYGIKKVSEVLEETEKLVDRYIPPPFGEGAQEASSNEKTVPERASQLTSKIGLRLYGHSIKRIMPIHNLGEDSAAKLAYTLDLLMQLKQNFANKSMQDYVDEAKLKASWIWEELNKEQSETTDAQKSLEQRALSFARRTTSVLVHAYNVTALPLSALPTSYQESIHTASGYAMELFTMLDQATNAGDITINWLQSVRQRVSSLEELIQKLKTQEIEMESMEPSEGSLDDTQTS